MMDTLLLGLWAKMKCKTMGTGQKQNNLIEASHTDIKINHDYRTEHYVSILINELMPWRSR